MENAAILLQQTTRFVQQQLEAAEGGHDYHHIQRVVTNARLIAAKETCNPTTVELAALLHDIADSKFHGGDEQIGPDTAQRFLTSIQAPDDLIHCVVQIIRNVSYKGGVKHDYYTPELAVVQDADRLDAMGAIGIARAFNYGGFKNRAIYDPVISPVQDQDKESYKNSTAPTINHFYEKLLKLKELMNTATGKKMAEQRHQFMLTYLRQFFQEMRQPEFPGLSLFS